MAKYLKRIGTKKIVYEFEILIEKIEIRLPGPCQLSVLMKRGNRKAETQRRLNYDPRKPQVLASEALLMKASLYMNLKNNKFLDKIAHLYIKVITGNGKSSKSGGEIKVNLSYYPNKDVKESSEELRLEKSPDSQAKLFIKLKCNKLGEATENDSDSDASEKSNTSRSDVSFDNALEDVVSNPKTEENRENRDKSLPKPKANQGANKPAFGKTVTPPRSPRPGQESPRKKEEKMERKGDTGQRSKIFDLPEKKTVENSFPSNKSPQKPGFEVKKPVLEQNSEIKKPAFEPKEPILEGKKGLSETKEKELDPKRPVFDPKKPITEPKYEVKKPVLEVKSDVHNSNFQTFQKPGGKAPNPEVIASSNKKGILTFDDEEEEEKLPNFGSSKTETFPIEKQALSNPASGNYGKPMNDGKFSFARKEVAGFGEVKKAVVARKESEDEDDDNVILPALVNTEKIRNSNSNELMEYLNKIEVLENKLKEKDSQILDYIRKVEESQKKAEEFKQMAYKANKEGGLSSKTLQSEVEKLRAALKDSEEKKQGYLEELRQISSKLKKLELDYKNACADYENLAREQKSKEENFYDLQGQKESIEMTNKSYSLELKSHKDKIAALNGEIQRLRNEQKKSADENSALQQKIDSLQFSLDSNSKEIDKVRSQTQNLSSLNENTFKELQAKNEALVKELRNQIRIADGQREEALSSQTKLALELQQAKIEKEQLSVRLENKMKDINSNDQGLMEKAAFYEKENLNLKKKIAKLQSEFGAERDELASNVDDLQREMKMLRGDLMESEKQRKELESEIISHRDRPSTSGEIAEGLETMRLNFDKQLKIMKKQLDLKDQKLNESESRVKQMEEEIAELQVQLKKMDFSKNRSSSIFEPVSEDELRRKNEELELKLLNKEEEYMDKVEALEKEIEALKMQVINSGPVRVSKGGGDDMEAAALSVENQKLRKQLKELQSKGGNLSSRGGTGDEGVIMKENEMLKKKNKELESEKQRISEELINLKMSAANYDNNKEISSKVLNKYTEQIRDLESRLQEVGKKLIESKQKLGDAINAALEIGDNAMADKLMSFGLNTRLGKKSYDSRVKLLMLGESGVGKTNLLLRFSEDKFSPNFITTLGVEYKQRIVNIANQNVMIQVWDTAGQERFRTITPIYYKSVDGVVLVFDVTDENSYNSLNYWMKNLKENGDPNITTILVGNKIDLHDKRVVTREKGEEMANTFGLTYFETSAKTDSNVYDAFVDLTKEILKKKGMGIVVGNGEDGKRETMSMENHKQIHGTKKKCC